MKIMEKIFDSPADLLSKIKKDKKQLEELLLVWNIVAIRESLFNFTVGCYHLIEWVKEYYPNLKKEVDNLRNDDYLRACRDLCNVSKHVKLLEDSKYPPVVSDGRNQISAGR